MTKSINFIVLNISVLVFLIGIGESAIISNADSSEINDLESNKLHVTTIDDIHKFIELHPGVHVEQLTLHSNLGGRLQYVLGARIAGDNLVAHGAKNQQWPSLQNVAVTLSYPASGLGKQVTYVAVQVDQTSNFGQAYVLHGGLHQRAITIVVEAYNTLYLNYDAQFYGV